MARRSHSEPHPEPEFMSLSDAGALIGYSTDTLKKRIEEGRLPVWRDGRTRRVRPDDVRALLTRADPQGLAHPDNARR